MPEADDPTRIDPASELAAVYHALRELAQQRLRREAPGHTLQPTALVHEAYMRLVGSDRAYKDRSHFFASVGRAMRNVLVDHARRKKAAKRSPDPNADMQQLGAWLTPPDDHVLDVDELVQQLEREDPQKGAIVNLRYFVGLTVEETADALDISVARVEREWRYIRTWLRTRLQTPE